MAQAEARPGSQPKSVGPLRGDIWRLRGATDWVVVPTNVGWKGRDKPIAVMGRGLAVQAARLYPEIPSWYGGLCATHRVDTPVVEWATGRLFLFPTKPLYEPAPNRSWAQPSSLLLIENGMVQLHRIVQRDRPQRVLIPLLGCGNGGLDPVDVRRVIDPYISASNGRLVLVLPL